jgi:tRNA wybutosine-synthesizing protein 3
MVAVRSAGYSFDSIIGHQDETGRNVMMVNERHLETLVAIANDRFKINLERITRFRSALLDIFKPSDSSTNGSSTPVWEDADARKQRKREEGLARQQALKNNGVPANDSAGKVQEDVDVIEGMFN